MSCPVNELSLSVNELFVDEMSVDEMSVDGLSRRSICVDEMSRSRQIMEFGKGLTYAFSNTSQSRCSKGSTRQMSSHIISLHSVLTYTHVLTNIRYLIPLTTGHMVPSICHTPHNFSKEWITLAWMDSCGSF